MYVRTYVCICVCMFVLCTYVRMNVCVAVYCHNNFYSFGKLQYPFYLFKGVFYCVVVLHVGASSIECFLSHFYFQKHHVFVQTLCNHNGVYCVIWYDNCSSTFLFPVGVCSLAPCNSFYSVLIYVWLLY